MIGLLALACVNAFVIAQGGSLVTEPFFGVPPSTVVLSAPVNAMASVDGVLYGLSGQHIVTVSATGQVTVRGSTPSRVMHGYAAAAVGHRWVIGTGDALVSLDVPSFRIVADTHLSVPVRAGDLDYYNGSLYALADTSPASLVRISPSTGVVATVASLPGVPRGGQFGAVAIDPLGTLNALHNATGRFFHIPLARPAGFSVTESSLSARFTDAATCPSLVDHGDAPASYGDASHVAVGSLTLGASGVVDDGLAAPPVLSAGARSFSVTVSVRNGTSDPALLAGWHDLDRDGRFEAADRASAVVPPGTHSLVLDWPTVTVSPGSPSAASSRLAELRLRLFGSVPSGAPPADPSPVGPAVGGEVEDYPILVRSPSPSASPFASPAASPSRLVVPPLFRLPPYRPPVLSPAAFPPPPPHLRVPAAAPPYRPPGRRTPMTWAVFIGLIVPALVVAARVRR